VVDLGGDAGAVAAVRDRELVRVYRFIPPDRWCRDVGRVPGRALTGGEATEVAHVAH
jgi:hypothetical protein